VDGEALGSLELRQTAIGGFGGASERGFGGAGGDALNALSIAKSLESLNLTLVSTGGAGGALSGAGISGGRGGSASAIATGANDAGLVRINVSADGGAGGAGLAGVSPGAGGDAIASATATTEGDGHGIFIASDFGADGGGGTLFQGTAVRPSWRQRLDVRRVAPGDSSVRSRCGPAATGRLSGARYPDAAVTRSMAEDTTPGRPCLRRSHRGRRTGGRARHRRERRRRPRARWHAAPRSRGRRFHTQRAEMAEAETLGLMGSPPAPRSSTP
jgi:hypothetical protein